MPNQRAVALAACQVSGLQLVDLKERVQHAHQRLTYAHAAALAAQDNYSAMRSELEERQLLDFTCGVGRQLCNLRMAARHP